MSAKTDDPFAIQLVAIGAVTAMALGAGWSDVERLWFEPTPDSDGTNERLFVTMLLHFSRMRRDCGMGMVRLVALDVARRQMEAAK